MAHRISSEQGGLYFALSINGASLHRRRHVAGFTFGVCSLGWALWSSPHPSLPAAYVAVAAVVAIFSLTCLVSGLKGGGSCGTLLVNAEGRAAWWASPNPGEGLARPSIHPTCGLGRAPARERVEDHLGLQVGIARWRLTNHCAWLELRPMEPSGPARPIHLTIGRANCTAPEWSALRRWLNWLERVK
jgi:hypothetical protein